MVINMVYDHLVKHNGKYYNPGEEVPNDEESLFLKEPEVSNEDIVMDTNAAVKAMSNSRRGRPKKSE